MHLPPPTLATSGSYSFSASIALSAFLSCHTPTQAFAMRINKMTNGSTKAVTWSFDSSNNANTWLDQCDDDDVVEMSGGW